LGTCCASIDIAGHKLSRDNVFGYIEEKTIYESSTGPRTIGGAFEITSRQDETVVIYRNIFLQ
jgi:hypothetical protein